jgi:hypothetical protein
MSQESAIAKRSIPQNWSKQVWNIEVARMIQNQEQRMMDVAKIRLNYIQFQYQLEHYLSKLKTFDNLGPGFSMMDYEVLLKKKEVYKDKRDEQCESIRKTNINNLTCTAVRIIRKFFFLITAY